MNDITDKLGAVGDRLEATAERVEHLVSDLGDTVSEEAKEQSWLTWGLWAALVFVTVTNLWEGNLRAAFVAFITLCVTMLPLIFQRLSHFRIPKLLIFLITLFAVCTLVLGEVFDFYEEYWWWDVALHSGSAVMFGIFGIILIMLVFETSDLDASPLMVSLFAFCFAMAVGAIWEIFEFGMDEIFGLNMQKSGLIDTMWDLIVDAIGGIIGASAGWVYLKFGKKGPISGVIDEVIKENPDKMNPSKAAEAAG